MTFTLTYSTKGRTVHTTVSGTGLMVLPDDAQIISIVRAS